MGFTTFIQAFDWSFCIIFPSIWFCLRFFCVRMNRKINLININNGIIWMVGFKICAARYGVIARINCNQFFLFLFIALFWVEFYFNSTNNSTLSIESEWNVFTFGVDRYFHYFFRVDIVNRQSRKTSTLLKINKWHAVMCNWQIWFSSIKKLGCRNLVWGIFFLFIWSWNISVVLVCHCWLKLELQLYFQN